MVVISLLVKNLCWWKIPWSWKISLIMKKSLLVENFLDHGKTSGCGKFSLSSHLTMKCIQDFHKHLRWRVLQRKLTTFKRKPKLQSALTSDVCLWVEAYRTTTKSKWPFPTENIIVKIVYCVVKYWKSSKKDTIHIFMSYPLVWRPNDLYCLI